MNLVVTILPNKPSSLVYLVFYEYKYRISMVENISLVLNVGESRDFV